MKLLIEYGANIDAIAEDWSVTELALDSGYSRPLELLLASGVNLSNLYNARISYRMSKIIDSFKQNKIKFILEHNDQAKFALKALEKIKDQFNIHSLSTYELKCLSDQPEGIIEDLNAICGEDGSYYTNSQL